MMNLSTTALLLVGYQNDYFAVNGILRGVVEEPNRVDTVLANTLAFIRRLSATPITIISTPIVLDPDYRAFASPVGILNAIKESGAFKAGTCGADDLPELKSFGDRIQCVRGKVGFSAFSDTTLDGVLRARQIKNVILAGMITTLCIDSTGRAAYERGYGVTILADCTSARTPTEQNFFCEQIFPLYANVADSAVLATQLVDPVN